VIRSLIQLIARVTKHGWFDFDKSKGYIFRDILDEIGKFLQGSVAHCIIGIQVLHELVVEMNTVESARSLANHRKVAGSFRDETLYDVFTLSTTLLQQTIVTDGQQQILIEWLLKLCSICLCFDFIGNSSDESSDDFTTVQIPTNWRPLFRDFSTLNLFLGFVHSLPYRLSAIALSCLVQLASVRRSLFSNLERSQYLEQLTKGIKDILEMPQCLSDPVCYHEFCRLLVRLKSNYQLAELMKLEHYPQFLQLIAKFTISSLQSWQFSENSIHYLLCLWQKMVGSVAYIRVQDNHLLNSYVPDIVKMYITSRLESVEGVLRNGLENPLDDETGLGQQLDQISVIAR
jgi:exportin-7